MICLICLDARVVDIFHLGIDCDEKCSKTSKFLAKLYFKGCDEEET